MNRFDIVIVGNGVLGLSTAYALSLEEPNLKIAIIGPLKRKGCGTLAAGAMLNCFAEINKFTLRSKHSLHKFNIAKQALRLWPQWLNQINDDLSAEDRVKFKPGTFVLLNSKAGKRENEIYVAIQKALREAEEPFEEFEPSEIPGLNPIDDVRPLKSLYIPNEGSIQPDHLLAALEKIMVQFGNVTFFDDVVSEILFDHYKATGVNTKNSGSLQTGKVLLTTGAFTQKLIKKIPTLVNRIPKIFASPGCALILKANNHQVQNVIRTPIRSGSCGVHLLPYDKNPDTLYLGASNAVRLVPQVKPKTRDIYYLLEHAMEQFNQSLREAKILKWKMGNRPVTFDTFPLIGETSLKGLWLLTGTYRDGFHSSPLLAMSMAKEILGKKPLFTHHFQPERFPLEIMSRKEMIEELVDQYISVGYEHGMKLPKLCWGSDIKEMAYKHIQSIYDQLEIDIGIAPDLFIVLHYVPEMIPMFRTYYQTLKNEFAVNEPKQMSYYDLPK